MAGQYNYILTKNESERKMERFEIENSREFKAAQELARALNDYGWNEKRFALATTTFHQTLQQTLFRTIVEILKVYAMQGSPPTAVGTRSKGNSCANQGLSP